MLQQKVTLIAFIAILLSLGIVDSATSIDFDISNHQGVNSFKYYQTSSSTLAAEITSDALFEARNYLQHAYDTPITQKMVGDHLEAIMRAEGASHQLAFQTLVMSGPELELPHGDFSDDSTHVINPSLEKIVMIDMGCKVNGRCTDVTRTFFYEGVSETVLNAYTAVLKAQESVIEAMKDGESIAELDSIVRAHLKSYVNRDDVYFYPYWGHGVGRFVHERPTLWSGSNENLASGQILAIEPALFFEDGWAVRVEDVVEITGDGVNVLSYAPKSLDDVVISPNDSIVDCDFMTENYVYGRIVNVSAIIVNNGLQIDEVDYYDGYNWVLMDSISNEEFRYTYILNSSFSSTLVTQIKCRTNNGTFYFTERISAFLNATQVFALDPILQISEGTSGAEDFLLWRISHPGAEMIRMKISSYDAPDFDQTLILDSQKKVLIDLVNRSSKVYWTPWATGDTITLEIVPTGSVLEIGSFRFTIDSYEIGEIDILNSTTQPPTTTPYTFTETTTFSSAPTNITPTQLSISSTMILVAVPFGILIVYTLIQERKYPRTP